ncbi:MAG: hypothetical protein Q9201_001197 [Fulgogasparrea decipioides]
MASSEPSARERIVPRVRPTQGHLLQTENLNNRSQRFSWQNTPLEAQLPTFQQFSSPTNSTIDESPISPRDGYQNFSSIPYGQAQSQFRVEKPPVERTGSPYNLPGLHETHPAYFAPIVEETKPRQPESQPPAIPSTAELGKVREPVKSPPPAFSPNNVAQDRKDSPQVVKPDTDRSTLVYNPNSLAGPNAAVENHRPGQVAHPNAAIEPEWKHGLCEVDTLCCVGLCCPCIVYGKTQYRISRKTQKKDPTNMLGYDSCNGSCGLMALACGFQCEYYSALRSERIRILTRFIHKGS